MNSTDIQVMVFKLNGRIAEMKEKILNGRQQNNTVNPLDIQHVNNLMGAVKFLRACKQYDMVGNDGK